HGRGHGPRRVIAAVVTARTTSSRQVRQPPYVRAPSTTERRAGIGSLEWHPRERLPRRLAPLRPPCQAGIRSLREALAASSLRYSAPNWASVYGSGASMVVTMPAHAAEPDEVVPPDDVPGLGFLGSRARHLLAL